MNFTAQSLKNKGIKIVNFPTTYDLQSIVPFLLLNDHSILLVRNPKKDVLPLLKSIIKYGVIWYKPPAGGGSSGQTPNAKPIRVNFTVWIFIDVLPWLEKLNRAQNAKKAAQPPKKVKDICEKEYGDRGELLQLFDIVIDIS